VFRINSPGGNGGYRIRIALLCIVAYNLWAAFSKRGYTYRVDRDR
jgi:hypothetical protein